MKNMNRNEMIAVTVGVILVAVILLIGIVNTFLKSAPEDNDIPNTTVGQIENVGRLIIEDIVVGSGEEAVSGKVVTAHYTGTLTNGTKFDSSLDRGQPFRFILGAGQVIKGWERGILGMKVGGKRKLTIPPELGYGERGIGAIPPNSTLIFEIELLGVSNSQ